MFPIIKQGMKRIYYPIIVLFIFLVSCKDENQYPDANYPTIVNDLTESKLNELYNLLYNINLYNCSILDNQGRLIQYFNDDLCNLNDSIPSPYSKQEILLYTKTLAAQNKELFGVSDTSEMQVLSIIANNGTRYENYFTADSIIAPPYWNVTYDRQEIDNLDVIGTELKFTIDADGIKGASGKWYPNVYIPLADAVKESDAQKSLYENPLNYRGTSFTPLENSTWFESEKIILPVYQSGQLKFHVCWALHPESWEVMVDTQDGQIITSVNIDVL